MPFTALQSRTARHLEPVFALALAGLLSAAQADAPGVGLTAPFEIDYLKKPGAQFDHLFLETFSRHHYIATTMSTECQVASDLKHFELERYCSSIVNGQLADIGEMRHMLCERFQICDYQPLRGLKGRHTGSESERGGDQE